MHVVTFTDFFPLYPRVCVLSKRSHATLTWKNKRETKSIFLNVYSVIFAFKMNHCTSFFGALNSYFSYSRKKPVQRIETKGLNRLSSSQPCIFKWKCLYSQLEDLFWNGKNLSVKIVWNWNSWVEHNHLEFDTWSNTNFSRTSSQCITTMKSFTLDRW